MRIRTTVLGVALIVGLAVLLSGCGGGGGGGGGETVNLTGYVYDDGSLQPIGNATVAAGSTSTLTSNTGTFTVLNVSSSQTTAKITAAGYQTKTVQIPAGSGSKSLGIIYLAPNQVSGTGNITGRLLSGGTPVGGATVTSQSRFATSKSDGLYTLYNVPAGVRTVQAASDGGSTGSASVTVLTGQTVTANMTLSIAPPPPPPI